MVTFGYRGGVSLLIMIFPYILYLPLPINFKITIYVKIYPSKNGTVAIILFIPLPPSQFPHHPSYTTPWFCTVHPGDYWYHHGGWSIQKDPLMAQEVSVFNIGILIILEHPRLWILLRHFQTNVGPCKDPVIKI